MIFKALFIAAGVLVLLAAFAVIVLLYHKNSQEMWRDITREESEERYEREREFRWRNQDIRIHGQMVIVDEMGGKRHDKSYESVAV